MGGNGNIDLSQIPLMTKAQEGALAELLPAVMGMMGGFELGTPYQPGAYSPTSFPEFTGEHIVKKDGDGEGNGGNGDDVIRKKQLEAPTDEGGDGRRGDDVIRKRQLSGPMDAQPDSAIDTSALDTILNPPPFAPGTIGGPVTLPSAPTSGGKGGTTGIAPETQPISPVQQAITEPIVSPFREGMTGNYPRRRI